MSFYLEPGGCTLYKKDNAGTNMLRGQNNLLNEIGFLGHLPVTEQRWKVYEDAPHENNLWTSNELFHLIICVVLLVDAIRTGRFIVDHGIKTCLFCNLF